MPSPVVGEQLKSGKLVPVLTGFLPKQYSIDALYAHREHLPAKVRSFVDLVAKNFRGARRELTEKQEIGAPRFFH